MKKLYPKIFKPKYCFTLIEVTVAVAVFVLVIAGASEIFISFRQVWQRQRDTFDLVQEARWAMEFICNDLHQAEQVIVPPPEGDRLRLRLPSNRRIEYRRTGSMLRRRWRQASGGWQNWEELANTIINNPSGNSIFRRHPTIGNLYIIEITLEKNNRRYTLRSMVRPRN